MTLVLVAAIALVAGGAVTVLGESLRRSRAVGRRTGAARIAFPFTGLGLSEPALGAALRIARAEGATLVPVYLALVPLELPLDGPLLGMCGEALPLLEAVEHRCARAEVGVDSRIERGRTVRHALHQLIAHERFQRIVVAASAQGRRGDGFAPEDIAWLLARAPGEVIALRPAPVLERAAPARSRRAPAPPAQGRGRVTLRGRSVARRVAHDVAGRRSRA